MPDSEVRIIRELIYYQYAKIIARRAFTAQDGKQAKQQHYGFIKKTFRELRDGVKTWSEITREDWQLVEAEKQCIYCGTTEDLHREHLVPKSLHISPRCNSCETIQGIHNQILACGSCNLAKGTKGLYEFYQAKHPTEKKFYDLIPPLAEKKYLKTIYNCHACAGTLDCSSARAGAISVLDVDGILH